MAIYIQPKKRFQHTIHTHIGAPNNPEYGWLQGTYTCTLLLLALGQLPHIKSDLSKSNLIVFVYDQLILITRGELVLS